MSEHKQLIAAALAARATSIAPFSKFQVGASLLAADGTIISGANVESASYGLSCCAERVALFKALTEGHRQFHAVAVASPGGAAPCGACRQLLAEYAAQAVVLLVDSDAPDSINNTTVATLLPLAFTSGDLPGIPPPVDFIKQSD